MKSFLEIIEEAKQGEKHAVMTFGRMNPPTTGHLKVIDKVKEIAHKVGGSHHIIVSHSQDTKKNPLSGEQKVKHLRRYSPGTNIESSSKEHPSIFHHAAKLYKKGVTHLHVVVGSDRVKEFRDSINKYNGVSGKHGHYKFHKITVHSAGQRDPDAEGSEGMSGTKMREHAKNKNFGEFRKGVPAHVSDTHTKELMHDTRKGMGLHESADHGRFKAIFVTGGPGSGKDVIIREAIPSSKIVELNLIQARDYLADKQKLSEKTSDYRREAIRNRGPLIINGPADDNEKITYIKEELEELGYSTTMVFVDTTNEASKERNERLTKTLAESIRYDKWKLAQTSKQAYIQNFQNFMEFNNSTTLDEIEEVEKQFNEMMGEEVRINGQSQEKCQPNRRIGGKAHLEKPDHAGDETADRGIHKAGKERHVEEFEQGRFGIGPAAGRDLEPLHHGAGQMKEKDDLGFLKCLKAEDQEQRLCDQRKPQERIIAGDWPVRLPEGFRCDDRPEHQPAKEARPAHLEAEHDEFRKAVRQARAHPAAKVFLKGASLKHGAEKHRLPVLPTAACLRISVSDQRF